MILTHFGKKIKVFWSDNAKEKIENPLNGYLKSWCYSSNFLSSHLPTMELLREKTNICLRLLTICYLPLMSLKFINRVVLVASYLINHMSQVLKLKSPISLLCPKQTLVCCFTLCTWCLCFPHVLSPNWEKLDPKAINVCLWLCSFTKKVFV